LGSLIALHGLLWSACAFGEQQRVSYFILAQTVEPLMITRDGEPMAGGMFTEIVKLVFRDSDYSVTPMVMPWQRMREELKRRNDWVIHGFPLGFEADIPFQLSEIPIFPFNHVAVTLKDHDFPITKPMDLFGKTAILVENFHYSGLDAYLSQPVAGSGSGDIFSVRAFSPAGTLQMLRHKRGDVVIGWQARLLYNLPASGLSIDDVRFQDASAIVPNRHMHFAFSPRWSDAFKQHVNARLKALQADGTLARIFSRYSGPKDLLQ
jgi:ABC-type amino acid transport substrate-binding protein